MNYRIGNIEFEESNEHKLKHARICGGLLKKFMEAHDHGIQIGDYVKSTNDNFLVYTGNYGALSKTTNQGITTSHINYGKIEEFSPNKNDNVCCVDLIYHMKREAPNKRYNQLMPEYLLTSLSSLEGNYLVCVPVGLANQVDTLIQVWNNIGRVEVLYIKIKPNSVENINSEEALKIANYNLELGANVVALITNWQPLYANDPDPEVWWVEEDEETFDFVEEVEEDTVKQLSEKDEEYFASLTIDDLKEAVHHEEIEPEEALRIEKENKNRVTLISWLEYVVDNKYPF